MAHRPAGGGLRPAPPAGRGRRGLRRLLRALPGHRVECARRRSSVVPAGPAGDPHRPGPARQRPGVPRGRGVERHQGAAGRRRRPRPQRRGPGGPRRRRGLRRRHRPQAAGRPARRIPHAGPRGLGGVDHALRQCAGRGGRRAADDPGAVRLHRPYADEHADGPGASGHQGRHRRGPALVGDGARDPACALAVRLDPRDLPARRPASGRQGARGARQGAPGALALPRRRRRRPRPSLRRGHVPALLRLRRGPLGGRSGSRPRGRTPAVGDQRHRGPGRCLGRRARARLRAVAGAALRRRRGRLAGGEPDRGDLRGATGDRQRPRGRGGGPEGQRPADEDLARGLPHRRGPRRDGRCRLGGGEHAGRHRSPGRRGGHAALPRARRRTGPEHDRTPGDDDGDHHR